MKKVQVYIKSDEENAFLSASKIIKTLIMNYIFISKASVQRFLHEEGLTWKELIIRLKMKCYKIQD